MNYLAQAILATSPPSTEGDPTMAQTLFNFLPLILIFLIFYFLLIAPARKKQKAHAAMIAALKNGDRVITNGGILGTVVGVTDEVIQLRIAEKVKVDIARNAVAGLQQSPGE